MRISLLQNHLKPQQFQDQSYYFLSYNTEPIRVGDVIAFEDVPTREETVLEIWFIISRKGPHLEMAETDIGHKHCIRLSGQIIDLPKDTSLKVRVVKRGNELQPDR